MNKEFPKRGDIFWVILDPTLGAETKKTRPCLIVSNNVGNEFSPMVIVAPITSQHSKVYQFETLINVKGKTGKVMPQQVRFIDKTRLGKKIGAITSSEMKMVDEAIKIVFALT